MRDGGRCEQHLFPNFDIQKEMYIYAELNEIGRCSAGGNSLGLETGTMDDAR
jgi:hypothetical protein